MARKKANNRMLVILLALIAVVCVALWYADKVEREGKAAAAEQPADEAAEAAAATLAGEGAEAPDFTVEMIDGSKVALMDNDAAVKAARFLYDLASTVGSRFLISLFRRALSYDLIKGKLLTRLDDLSI